MLEQENYSIYIYELTKYEVITACLMFFFLENIESQYNKLKERIKNYVLNENNHWLEKQMTFIYRNEIYFKDNIDFFMHYLKNNHIDPNNFLQDKLNINVQWCEIKKWPEQEDFLLFEIISAIICFKRYNKTTVLSISNIYQKIKCIIKFSKNIVAKLNLSHFTYYLSNIQKFKPPTLKRSTADLDDDIQIKTNIIRIHNLTQNFMVNPQLMHRFTIYVAGIDDCITDNINWETQMFHKEISFALQDTCFVGCKKNLKLSNTSSQCVIYDINKIQIGISTSKICPRCKTQHRHNSIITNNNNMYFLPLSKTKYCELSPETVFTKELLHDFGKHFLKHGMGAEAYIEMYNERNEILINHIQQRVKQISHRKNTIKLERNKLSIAFFLFFGIKYIYTYNLLKNKTLSNRLNCEQIFVNSKKVTQTEPPKKKRRLSNNSQEGIEINKDNFIKFEHDHQLICVTNDDIDTEKNKLILYSNIMSKKPIQVLQYGKIVWKGKVEFATGTWCLINLNYPIGFCDGSVWGFIYKTGIKQGHGLLIPEQHIDFKNKNHKGCTDYKIIWNNLYDKYLEDGMKNATNPILEAIPVINGIPPAAVAQTYGDGNAKIDLKICIMHYILLKLLSYDTFANISKLEKSQRESYQCINRPYQANKFAISSKLCAYHFMMVWILSGLPLLKVNAFIEFFHLRLRINKIHKKINQNKELTKHEENILIQWNQYHKHDKNEFENVISSFIYFYKLHKYRKITGIIQFKKPDFVTLNQSFHDNKDNVVDDVKFIYLNEECMFLYI